MNFIPVSAVIMDDPFWAGRFSLIRDVVLPYMWEILNDRVENAEISHCIENFKIAAGLSAGEFYGTVFVDSDLYKWIEAVSYCLSVDKNEILENTCNQAIALIAAAQQPDGYVNTYFTTVAPEKRWMNLMEGHELYCAGHLIEAAVAHYQATGDETLLKIARRFADLIDKTFGNSRQRGYPGHSEIELALIRLYEVTGERRYLDLSGYFLNERGTGEYIFEAECNKEDHTYIFQDMKHYRADYFQAHQPVREQCCATGHAVRAMYLYSAMADYARISGEEELATACERIFNNTITRQMYITGGIGSARLGERFTIDFDLPSDTAYTETCASIGLMFFSSRMWLLNQKKNCYDIWEQALYNTVLSGMGRDGKHYFYVNPVESNPKTILANPTLSHIKSQRQKWFGVACCPPNLARILSSMRGYIYALDDNRLYVLSHIGSSFQKGGLYVKLARAGDKYTITIEGDPIEIYLRLPENSNLIGEQYLVNDDGYFVIHHTGGWQQYTYVLKPMVRILQAHPYVSALSGKLCVQRGLATYCLEGTDNITPLSILRLPADAEFIEEMATWLDDDMPVLKTSGYCASKDHWDDALYASPSCEYESTEITFVPYSQWGNRGENEMRVWLNEK